MRLTVPRLSGHSGQDTQKYKSAETIREERARDPLPRLKEFLAKIEGIMSETEWEQMAQRAETDVRQALRAVRGRDLPDPAGITRFVFSEEGCGRQSHPAAARRPVARWPPVSGIKPGTPSGKRAHQHGHRDSADP